MSAARENAGEEHERSAWLEAELSRPEVHGGAAGRIETRRTLLSLLVFAGDRVYKLRRAVDVGYVDQTTLERRRALCEEELRLNADLAPGVHRGVVAITRGADGHLRLGGPGPAVEWAVEMERLPEERMLARLLERGAIDNALLNGLVERLVAFHERAPTGAGIDEFGTPEGIATSVEENFAQLGPFVGKEGLASERLLAFLGDRARSFLEEQAPLLAGRVAAGRIREGHGDLHAENVCVLEDGFAIYDRIEFNRRFRCLDVANDLAFLAMDLDQRGFPGFASYLARRYARRAGDAELERLLAFYKGYRAIVRAKVAALSLAGAAGDAARDAELARTARRYLHLAAGYELRPTLVLLCGLPACGKTTFATALARPLRAARLHSDVRRKRRAGLAPERSARAAWGQGLYRPEAREATYRSLLVDAVRLVRAGRSVVVDATFAARSFRAPFVDAAARLDVPWVLVHLEAREEVVRARLEARAGRGASDADLGVYLRAREAFEPPEELPEAHRVGVDAAGGTPEERVARVLERRVALETAP